MVTNFCDYLIFKYCAAPHPRRIISILMPLLLLVPFSVKTNHDSIQDYESVTMPLLSLQKCKCSQLDKFLSIIVDLKSI